MMTPLEQQRARTFSIGRLVSDSLAVLVFTPIGISGGIFYSIPVAFLCREKQPWCSLLLAGCLFATVWAIGTWTGMSPDKIRLAWYWSLAAYALCLCVMGVDNLIEPFMATHILCILLTGGIGAYDKITRAALKEKARTEQVSPEAASVPLKLPCPAA